jgi:hypothetical protein
MWDMNVKKSVDNEKKSVGRPKKYGDESATVKRRNITVTDPGWEGLHKTLENNNLASRSELLEQIGRENLKVLSKQQFFSLITAEEIPVLSRLVSLIEKTAYMRSIITFARLVILKTGNSKENDDKLIEDVILEAITCIALRDYVYPDNQVISALADTTWLVFRLILLKLNDKLHLATKKDICISIVNKNTSLNPELEKIFDSIYYFSISFPSDYQIYEMRMMESLTWPQIHRLLKIRGSDITEDEIRDKNHKAVEKIREVWHDSIVSSKHRKDPDKIKLKKEMEKSLLLAQKYYDLINNQDIFSSSEFEEWEQFLLESMKQSRLDLLLPEIHHSWVHENIENDKSRELYKKKSSDIMDHVIKRFEGNLSEKLGQLKQKLKFCGNKRRDIQDILMEEIFSGISEQTIPINYFLGDRCSDPQP